MLLSRHVTLTVNEGKMQLSYSTISEIPSSAYGIIRLTARIYLVLVCKQSTYRLVAIILVAFFH